MAMLFTMRGIPCLYYGTELLFTNPIPRTNDGQIRQDFPGGWVADTLNKFIAKGRTTQEQTAFLFAQKLIQLRKTQDVLTTGKTMQFTPEENHYEYFRYNDNVCFMIVFNRGSKELNLTTERYAERMQHFTKGYDHFHEENIADLKTLHIPANSCRIIELKP
jgi:glycosidase